MTLRLRPGLHVARRDHAHLQVGLDPPARVVLPDDPDVRRLLDRLVGGSSRPGTPVPAHAGPGLSPVAREALARLHGAGLVEDDASAGARPGAAGPVVLEPAGELAAGLLARLRTLLVADGVDLRDDGLLAAPEGAELVVLVATGEPRRAAADAHLRDGRPHLVIGGAPGTPGGIVLGPLVCPGLTACLRCVDAHRSETDPRRGLVLAQLEGRPGALGDTALTTLAAAWAARDVRSFLAGRRPTTWSATVTIGPDATPQRQEWRRHPWCGCAWDVLARAEDQRGAG